MADSNFIFNLAFKTEGGEEVNRIRLNLDKLVAAQQRITSTSRQQGVAQKSLTEENKLFARATELSIQKLDRQRATLKKGSVEYARNNRATATLQNSLNSLNTTNDRYNSTVIANQKREQRRKEALIASSGATQKLEQETKSFISSLGQSTSMTERNINEANQLVGSIDKQISANQKLQRTVGLTRKQQSALAKEEQRLVKTKESLQNRVSSTNNRFEQFKRTAATTRADLQRLSADNLRAGDTTEAHKKEQERLEEVITELSLDFKLLSESAELSEQQMAQMSSTLAGVKGAALQTDRNIKGMSNAFSGQTKATNSANQILLSFGDIAQDSAQFQFGFAQGMRAIGNNITFAAEQFTIFAAKTAAANGGTFTMKAGIDTLRRSLMGVGGLIILLNIAVTAITVLTSSMRKNKKEAEDLAESNDFLTEAIDRQIKSFQDAKKAQDEFYDSASIQSRMESVTRRRDILQNTLIPGLQREIELEKQAIQETKDRISQTRTLFLQSRQREKSGNLTEKEIQAEQQLRLELFERGKFLEETLQAQEESFPAQKKFLEDTINIREKELKQTDTIIRRLNLEEKLLGGINKAKEEGGALDKERENFIVPTVSDPLMIQDSIEASKELEMFRAEQITNEFDRAKKIRDLRVQDAEDRRFALEISETRERLIKEQAEQEYQDTLNELRDEELERERERQEKVLEIQRETANQRLQIEKFLSDSTRSVNQQMIQSIQSSLGSLLGQTKVSAIAMLVIEKGLAIGRLMADATAKATALKTEATKLAFEGGAKLLNPLTAAQGAMELKKAGALKAAAGTVMATAKKNSAKIAALGLGQIIGVAASGGGGGSASGGGAAGGGSTSFGTSSEEVSDRERLFGPRYLPSPQMQSGSTTIIVEAGYTQDGELAFNAKKSEGRLDQSILSGNASVIEVS